MGCVLLCGIPFFLISFFVLATFVVHRNPDGTIRLQNVGDSNHWLRINENHAIDGKGVGT